MGAPRTRTTLFGGLMICCTLFGAFYGLGSYPLMDPDEPRYARSAVEMIERGDYLVPYFDGEPRLHKLPLYYWLEVASYKLLGVQNEISARFPSAVAGLVTGFFAFILALRLRGESAAVFALPILFSMPLFTGLTHLSITDAALTAFLTGALYCWWRMRDDGGAIGWQIVSWFMLAAAVLAKGPIAAALYVLIIIAFLALRKEWGLLKRSFYPAGIVVFAAVALPWPVAVLLARPGTAALWYDEIAIRFASGSGHGGNPLDPLGVLIAGTLPWILLVGLPAGTGIREKMRAVVADEKSLFLFVWTGVTVVFFTACMVHANYMLPAVPAVAIAAAGVLGRLWDNPGSPPSPLVRTAIAAGVIVAGATGYAVYGGRISPGGIVLLGAVTSVMTAVMVILVRSGKVRAAAAALAAVLVLGMACGTVSVMKEISLTRSLAPLATAWQQEVAQAEELYFLGNIESNGSLVYYTGRAWKAVKSGVEYRSVLAGSRRTAIVQRRRSYEAFLRRGVYGVSDYLAGGSRTGKDEFVLVTNFPTAASRPIVGPPAAPAP